MHTQTRREGQRLWEGQSREPNKVLHAWKTCPSSHSRQMLRAPGLDATPYDTVKMHPELCPHTVPCWAEEASHPQPAEGSGGQPRRHENQGGVPDLLRGLGMASMRGDT